jgi:hypothetical protein
MLSLDLWCDRVFGDGAAVPLAAPGRSDGGALATNGAGTGAAPEVAAAPAMPAADTGTAHRAAEGAA